MAENIGTLTAQLGCDIRNFQKNLTKAEKEIKQYERKTDSELDKADRRWKKHGRNTSNAMTGVKTAITGVTFAMAAMAGIRMFVNVTKEAMQFESTMKRVKAVSGATGQQFQDLTNVARDMGATTEWSANQAAEGLKFTSMAGFDAQESIKALPGMLDLATIAQMDLAQASDITTDVLTAFGLSAENTGRLTDALVNTITRSNTNVQMLGESFKYVAAVAAQMGYDVEQTASYLGVLANSGIKASMAGTHLRQIMLRTSKAAEKLGMDSGASLNEVLAEMKKRMFTAAQVSKFFGMRATASALVLMNNVDAVQKLNTELDNNRGATKKVAKEVRDSTENAWKILQSTISGLKLDIAEVYTAELVKAIKGTTKVLQDNKEIFIALGEEVKRSWGYLNSFISAMGWMIDKVAEANKKMPYLKKMIEYGTPGVGSIRALEDYTAKFKELIGVQEKVKSSRSNLHLLDDIKKATPGRSGEGSRKSNVEDYAGLGKYQEQMKRQQQAEQQQKQQQIEDAIKLATEKEKIQKEWTEYYRESTWTTYELEKQALDDDFARFSKAVKDKTALQEAYNIRLAELKSERDERQADKVDSYFTDHDDQIDKARDEYQKKIEMQAEFTDAYKQMTMSAMDYEKEKLWEQYQVWYEIAENKLQVNEWYIESLKKLTGEAEKNTSSWEKGMTDALTQIQKKVKTTAEMISTGLTMAVDGVADAMVDWATGAKSFKEAFGDMARQVVKELATMIIKQMVYNALVGEGGGAGGGGAGGGSGGSSAGQYAGLVGTVLSFFHGGGIVGVGGSSQSAVIPANTFQNAPKLHDGTLGSNEVPAVLEKGEGVFTADQMKAIGNGAGGEAPPVNVTNVNVMDPSVVGEYLNTDDGHDVVLNVMQKNKDSLQ